MEPAFESSSAYSPSELTAFRLVLSRAGNALALFERRGELPQWAPSTFQAAVNGFREASPTATSRAGSNVSFPFELGLRVALHEALEGQTSQEELLIERLESAEQLTNNATALSSDSIQELRGWLRAIERSISSSRARAPERVRQPK